MWFEATLMYMDRYCILWRFGQLIDREINADITICYFRELNRRPVSDTESKHNVSGWRKYRGDAYLGFEELGF